MQKKNIADIARISESLVRLPQLRRICVMVDFFVDRFVRVENLERLMTLMRNKRRQGGGSVRGINQTEVKGGNAVNIAYALGNLRANVNLLAVANSLPAEFLRSTFAGLPNVDLRVIDGNPGYTVAFEFKEKRRHVNVMISEIGDLANFDGGELSKYDLKRVNEAEIVAVVNWAANSKGTDLCKRIFTLARKSGARTFFDPADITGLQDRLNVLRSSVFDDGLVNYVSLNENEARVMSKVLFKHKIPLDYTVDDLRMAASILSHGIGSVVDIHTARVSVSAAENEVVSANCFKVKQKTITGAGDVWAAADLAGYLTSLEARDRLDFANAAAGLYVSGESAIPPTLDEVLDFMKKSY